MGAFPADPPRPVPGGAGCAGSGRRSLRRSLSRSPSLVASFRPGMLMSPALSGETPRRGGDGGWQPVPNCW